MAVVYVGEGLALDSLRHDHLPHHPLVVLVLNGEDASDEYPRPRGHRGPKGDLAEELVRDLDGAEADVLQQAQGLHFCLHTGKG